MGAGKGDPRVLAILGVLAQHGVLCPPSAADDLADVLDALGAAHRKPSDLPDRTRERKQAQRERARHAMSRDVTPLARDRGVTHSNVTPHVTPPSDRPEHSESQWVTLTGDGNVTPPVTPRDVTPLSRPLSVTAPVLDLVVQKQESSKAAARSNGSNGKHQVALQSLLEQTTAKRDRRSEKEAQRREAAGFLFSYWQRVMGKPRSLLNDTRETRIVARLRENGDDVGELLHAIDGNRAHAYYQQEGHNSDEFIFRNREQVEKNLDKLPKGRAGVEHPMLVEYRKLMTQGTPTD